LGSFRTFGHSKDHREDPPQVVVGMAVTRGGIPIRCWCSPGTTADVTMIEQAQADLRRNSGKGGDAARDDEPPRHYGR
jgi:transposase